ncbi:MAG: SUMF1/EgtB/PvdO family nonheme iron enzyme, partial [Myxococcales bacterium]|nr:SUMF1/EgtB/PvdO family nonheme iron enzyme [Myxococcales bacterium]
LTLAAADRAPITYPVHLGRQARWVAPDPVPLPPTLAPDEAYVPPGWFLFGGDAAATDPLPRHRIWLAGFVVKRRPVTNAEYAAFLRDRLATDGEAAARALLPANGLGPAGEATRWTLDDAVHAPAVEPADWPVVGIDWHAATAYAAWLATHTGLPWRLPHECEWEKAARGVDGRCFPWGDHVDPSWACMFDSRPGNASRSPVGAFAADESPYGVRDTAGNVREWCRNAYRRAGPVDEAGHLLPDDDPGAGFRVAKGGAWSSTRQACRAAGRFGARPGDRFNSLGLRVARPWPGDGQSSP